MRASYPKKEAGPYDGVAVIFAGGVGSRMEGAKRPKQFLELGGKAIICHVLDRFEEASCIQALVLVCVDGWQDYLSDLVDRGGYTKVVGIASGGETGQSSIRNGLLMLENLGCTCDETIVLVHDGVRPLISSQTIEDCFNSVSARGCTAVTAPVTETVVVCEGEMVNSVVDRSKCRLARAPQGFFFNQLLAAHRQAISDGLNDFVDSISLMSYYGYEINVVDGPEQNIKITSPRDFLTFKGFVDLEEYKQIWT